MWSDIRRSVHFLYDAWYWAERTIHGTPVRNQISIERESLSIGILWRNAVLHIYHSLCLYEKCIENHFTFSICMHSIALSSDTCSVYRKIFCHLNWQHCTLVVYTSTCFPPKFQVSRITGIIHYKQPTQQAKAK